MSPPWTCAFPPHLKLVMMTYLCQIFIWKKCLLIVHTHKLWRWERVMPSDEQRGTCISKEDASISFSSYSRTRQCSRSWPLEKDNIEVVFPLLPTLLLNAVLLALFLPQPSVPWGLKKSRYPSGIPGELDRNGIFLGWGSRQVSIPSLFSGWGDRTVRSEAKCPLLCPVG